MEKDNNKTFHGNPSEAKEPELNKSFVKRVSSRVSGLLPSSLSKWFTKVDNKPIIRPREEDSDSDCCDSQPPPKRFKIPSTETTCSDLQANSFLFTSFSNGGSSNNVNRSINTRYEPKQNSCAFLEPTAGPSGIRERNVVTSNTINNSYSETLLNGNKDDSDSDESTSGYSSLLRTTQKDSLNVMDVKKVNLSMHITKPNSPHLESHSRSLFAERSLSPNINTSLSSRRPSFNLSTFGSPNFLDRTLSTKRIINSPFYSGKTTYGGASAYCSKFKDNRIPIRNRVQAKPLKQSNKTDATLSKTARRILDALENCRAPISDAKKITIPTPKPRLEGLLTKYTGANPYLIREGKVPRPSNKELQIPSVPDLLKMKLKEKLQDSTVAVRQIAITSKSALNNDEYKIKSIEEDSSKYTNKMKNKITATRQKSDNNNQTVEEVKLPEVTLPITTLPKFDFSVPLMFKPYEKEHFITVACNDLKPIPKLSEQSKKDNPSSSLKFDTGAMEYTFSNPLVLAENVMSIIAINDFKFSDPVFKQKEKTSDILINFKSPDLSQAVSLKMKNSNVEATQPSINFLESKNNKSELSSLDKFKLNANMWECSVCLIRNPSDKLKCLACNTAKPEIKKKEMPKSVSSFGEEFKMKADKWECGVCMVRNSSSDSKCVACATPKQTTVKPNGPITSMPNQVNSSSNKKSFLDSKKSVTWETDKSRSDKTGTPITFGFGDKFKRKNDQWECIVCMIMNDNDKTKCAACETPKACSSPVTFKLPQPVALSPPQPVPKFTFGIFPNVTEPIPETVSSSDDKEIKKPEAASTFGSSTVSTAMTTNTTTTTHTTITTAVPTFTFGIPITKTVVDGPATTKLETSKAPTGFMFGSTPTKTTESIEQTKAAVAAIPKLPEVSTSKLVETPKLTSVSNANSSFTFGKLSQSTKPLETNSTTTNSVPVSIMLPSFEKPKSQNTLATSNKLVNQSSFAFDSSVPTLKRSADNSEIASVTSAKKETPISNSLIFSPPNKSDLNLMKKPLNGNTDQFEKNIFASIAKSATPNNSFTFTPTSTFTPQTSTFTPQTSTFTSPTSTFTPKSSTFAPQTSTFTPQTSTFTPQTSTFTPQTSTFTPQTSTFAPQTSTFAPQTSTFTKPLTTSVSTNLFNFVAKTTTALTFGNNVTTANSSIMFGNPVSTIATATFGGVTTTTEAPVFKFNMNQSEPATNQPTFNMTTDIKQPATTNIFGTIPSTSIFGTPSKPAFETPPISVFGSTIPLGFGATEVKPFLFDTRPAEEPAAKTLPFSFGQVAHKPTEPAKAPGCVFGSSAPTNVPVGGGFSFNNNAAPNINFNFNPPKVDNPSPFQSAVAAPNIMFGASTSVPPQQQPVQNGGFNFGSAVNNAAVKPGFSFGTPQQFNAPPPAPATGVFSFGTNPNPAPPAAGGFNFGQNAPTPAFDVNIRPTFNFTGGATPTFSASPASENPSTAQRKKIRPVRRIQR